MRRVMLFAILMLACRPPAWPASETETDDDEGDGPVPDRFGVFRLPSGDLLYAAYAEVDGTAIVDGDMGFPLSARVSSGPRAYAAGVATTEQLWPGGVVPFMFDDSDESTLCPGRSGPIRDPSSVPFDRNDHVLIAEGSLRARAGSAMELWAPAGIRFRQLTGEETAAILRDQVPRVVTDDAHPGGRLETPSEVDRRLRDHLVLCRWSESYGTSTGVGRSGGRQRVFSRLASGRGGIAHELGHVIGLYHEQQRADRDRHVRLNESCVAGREWNFSTYLARGRPGRDLGPYDYGSIMHYGPRRFSNGCDTLTPIQNGVPIAVRIGQRTRPSAGDLEGVRTMYRGLSMQTAFREEPVVFAESNFRGSFQVLHVSRYDEKDLRNVRAGWEAAELVGSGYQFLRCGLPGRPRCVRTGEWVRSVRVPPGVIVTLCADERGDRCVTATESMASLPGLDGTVSMVLVERAVSLFTEPDFGGLRRTYRQGLYVGATIQDGRVASAVVPPGLHLSLCQGERRDSCLDLPGDHRDPGTTGALVTQVQVRAAATLFRPLDGAEPGKAESVTLLPGTHALGALGSSWADGRIGSIVVAPGLVLRLCWEDAPADAVCDDWHGDVPEVTTDNAYSIRTAIVLPQHSCEANWSCGRDPTCGDRRCEHGERFTCPQDCGRRPTIPEDEGDEVVCRLKPWMCAPR